MSRVRVALDGRPYGFAAVHGGWLRWFPWTPVPVNDSTVD